MVQTVIIMILVIALSKLLMADTSYSDCLHTWQRGRSLIIGNAAHAASLSSCQRRYGEALRWRKRVRGTARTVWLQLFMLLPFPLLTMETEKRNVGSSFSG